MKFIVLLVMVLLVAFGSWQPVSLGQPFVEKVETRCGWFSNPTPANASLYDSQREWIISVQGGYEAEGDWPDIPPKEWVETNVHYGYGCACMKAKVDRAEKKVLELKDVKVLPIQKCKSDKTD